MRSRALNRSRASRYHNPRKAHRRREDNDVWAGLALLGVGGMVVGPLIGTSTTTPSPPALGTVSVSLNVATVLPLTAASLTWTAGVSATPSVGANSIINIAINWGDGTTSNSSASQGFNQQVFNASHSYLQSAVISASGLFQISAVATDNTGAKGQASQNISIPISGPNTGFFVVAFAPTGTIVTYANLSSYARDLVSSSNMNAYSMGSQSDALAQTLNLQIVTLTVYGTGAAGQAAWAAATGSHLIGGGDQAYTILTGGGSSGTLPVITSSIVSNSISSLTGSGFTPNGAVQIISTGIGANTAGAGVVATITASSSGTISWSFNDATAGNAGWGLLYALDVASSKRSNQVSS